MTVDPEIPVPPTLYGGIERIVDMLVRELRRRGHEIHIFANPKSTVEAHLSPYPSHSSISLLGTIRNSYHITNYLHQSGPFDVVHSFARLAYLLPTMLMTSLPIIQSYQRIISPRSVRVGSLLARGSLIFTSCSASNAAPVRHLIDNWRIIHNGVDVSKYNFVNSVPQNAPLVFLGRIERIKGTHTAIEVALRTGYRLLIAGNFAAQGEHAEYFKQEILPYCDGKQIELIGPVDDAKKNTLLGQAAALLFPIEWDEPFGIVMVEALACGTPVIAFRQGSVPEVIEHGRTGFVCDTVEGMIANVQQIGTIDRAHCRQAVEDRFSEEMITNQYEALYYSVHLAKTGRG